MPTFTTELITVPTFTTELTKFYNLNKCHNCQKLAQTDNTQNNGLFATLSINDAHLKHQVPICWVSNFCVILRVNVLSTSCLNVMLSVVMLSVTLLIIMLSAIVLRVICAKCRRAFRFIIGLMIKLVWRLFDFDIIRQIIDY